MADHQPGLTSKALAARSRGKLPPAATRTSTPSTMTHPITLKTITTRIALLALTELKLWVDASLLRLNRIAANGPQNDPDGVETAGMTDHPQDGAATLRHPQSTMDHGDGFEADAAAAWLEQVG